LLGATCSRAGTCTSVSDADIALEGIFVKVGAWYINNG
jgi:hypothetical protein